MIFVVGIGPGHPDYVLPAARRCIEQAEVLVGGRRALADFAGPHQQTMTIAGDIAAVLDFIRKSAAVQDVVVMVSGDPGYYSLLDALRRSFSATQLQVIPGISSVQFAFARLALPWHDARLISMHGRKPSAEELGYTPGTILGILTDAVCHSQSIPAMLLQAGWPEDAEAFICARLSYEDETILHTSLRGAMDQEKFTHCVMVVKA
jgi:cobalt-precorrin-7 (C5)-methyltransferase